MCKSSRSPKVSQHNFSTGPKSPSNSASSTHVEVFEKIIEDIFKTLRLKAQRTVKNDLYCIKHNFMGLNHQVFFPILYTYSIATHSTTVFPLFA